MSTSGAPAPARDTITGVKPSFAQLTHFVTTLATLVIVGVLAANHTLGSSVSLAVIAAVTGTSLGIGANPPSSNSTPKAPGPG